MLDKHINTMIHYTKMKQGGAKPMERVERIAIYLTEDERARLVAAYMDAVRREQKERGTRLKWSTFVREQLLRGADDGRKL